MTALLVRVGADLSTDGGSWNGPVDGGTYEFAYVAIPESHPVHPGLEKPYSALIPTLQRFGTCLPAHLRTRHMHLDPDFERLTYGDQGARARQLQDNLRAGDLIVFYASLANMRGALTLVYALVGLFVVDAFVLAANVPPQVRDINAHSRRVLKPGATDLIVHGHPGMSGRLQRCLPVGEYRNRAYRVKQDLLDAWGGLSVVNGYLQRSARLPRFLEPTRFLRWLENQRPILIQANN